MNNLPMQWQYHMVERDRGDVAFEDIVHQLNELGAQGWELCGIDYGCWIMKRALWKENLFLKREQTEQRIDAPAVEWETRTLHCRTAAAPEWDELHALLDADWTIAHKLPLWTEGTVWTLKRKKLP
jgi:hypothetical protein